MTARTSSGRAAGFLVAAGGAAVVVQVADVHDDDADEDLERDAGDEHREHEVVEPVTLTSDVEQQLQLGDLSEAEDHHERRLRLRLRLLQLAVTGQQLAHAANKILNYRRSQHSLTRGPNPTPALLFVPRDLGLLFQK